jgi:hypothetical protein
VSGHVSGRDAGVDQHREFVISKGLERQIENDSWDGIIEAGKSNVSVLQAFVAVEQGPDGKNQPKADARRTNTALLEKRPHGKFRLATRYAG